jgi:hypothetical protein
VAGFAYRVHDLPVKGAGAFLPLTFPTPQASSYGLVRVSGSPGTLPQPAPAPEAVPPISMQRETQSSKVSPNYLLWDKYIPYADNMGPAKDACIGMALRRHTPLPVPARTWTLAPAPAMITRKTGGRTAMSWPRAFQRFPVIGSGGNG